MRRPHVNVATVLVDPRMLRELELELAGLDLWVWPIATTPNCPDGPRMAFQIRRRLVEARRGAWDWRRTGRRCGSRSARAGTAVPIRCRGPRTQSLWDKLAEYADHTRYRLGLGGVPMELVRRRAEL